MGYIYKATNIVDGKVYIGQTIRTISERWKEHIWDANKLHSRHAGFYLHSAIRKYTKDSFTVEMVEECDNDKLNERERYWIGFYQSNNKHFGYNLTDGGDSHFRKCPESELSRLKKSVAQTGVNNSFYGKSHSANHRASISTPVVAYTDDGCVYMYYISQISARKDGYQQSHITDCVNGKYKHHGKTQNGERLRWRFAFDDESSIIKTNYIEFGVESLTPTAYQEFKEEYDNAS